MDGQDRVVGGRYRLLGKLGAGAMGAVWRAEDTVLGREVAVKEVVFPPGIRPEEAEVLRERTRREARSAARLDHPSAVTVYDVVEEDGRPWLVMELVEARTLADVVSADGPLPVEQVAHIGLAVLGALEAAHRQGIVHRDVKPGNVMLTDAGRIVLTDFGIATSAEDPSLTGTGLLLGSPAYIAPERARGNAPGPASDLWSLGATLFTAVEGRPPFDGKDALETVTAVVTGEHAPYLAAGPLAPLLDALLVKEPADRIDATAARRLLGELVGAPHVPTPAARPAPARTDAGTAALDLGEVAAEARAAEDEDTQATSYLARPVAPAPVSPPARPRPPAPTDARRLAPEPATTRPPRVVREPARRQGGSRAPLVVAGVLLLLAALGLGYSFLSGEDSTPSVAGPDSSPSAGAAPQVPANWVTHTDPSGWTIKAPPEFSRTETGRDEMQLRNGETRVTLRIKESTPGPADADALSATRQAAYETLDDFQLLGRADGRELNGVPIVDLELTYVQGVELHVLDRSLVVGGTGYYLDWQTPEEEWSANRALFDLISSTFVPAPTG